MTFPRISDITIEPSLIPTRPLPVPVDVSISEPFQPVPIVLNPVDVPPDTLPFRLIPPTDPTRLFNLDQYMIQRDEPTVQLTTPYIPPAHVFAATRVSDMLDITVPYDMNWTYEVGTPPIKYKLGILVGNKCIENELRVDMSYPAYLIPDSPFPLVIPPLTVYNLGFSLNESEAINRVPSGNKLFNEEFSVITTVLNVTGPVYVKPQL